MALGTSWSTLAVQSFNFSYGGYSFTFEQAVDGYYEKLNSTTARVHLRGWIKNASSWGWTGTNKTWQVWCTNGASYSSGTQTDAIVMNAGDGHHLPSDNGVYFDIAAGSSFTVNMNYKIPIAGYDHTISASTSVPTFATPPSGLAVAWQSHTWNSVTTKSSVSSWGTGYSAGTQGLQHIVCTSAATPSTWYTDSMARRVRIVNTTSTTSTAAVTNSYDDWHPSAGPVNIKGCLAYKVAAWASTSVGDAGNAAFDNTTRYTPPAPPTISVTDAGYTFTQRKVTITCTGANTTYNYNNNVIFYYRYKKSTDSAYSAWTSMGTGAVTGSKSVTLTLPGSTTYNFQVLQQYQSQNSETKTATYTTLAVPDQGILYAPVNGTSKRVRKLYGSVNEESKEIVKLYGPVNGKSKRIY